MPSHPSLGGASKLSELLDVNIPAPANGDNLTFDTGSGKWVSSPGPIIPAARVLDFSLQTTTTATNSGGVRKIILWPFIMPDCSVSKMTVVETIPSVDPGDFGIYDPAGNLLVNVGPTGTAGAGPTTYAFLQGLTSFKNGEYIYAYTSVAGGRAQVFKNNAGLYIPTTTITLSSIGGVLPAVVAVTRTAIVTGFGGPPLQPWMLLST